MNTGFAEAFQHKLDRMRHHLKRELSKAKHERDVKFIRSLLSDARKLSRTLKEMRAVSIERCPHCGEKL